MPPLVLRWSARDCAAMMLIVEVLKWNPFGARLSVRGALAISGTTYPVLGLAPSTPNSLWNYFDLVRRLFPGQSSAAFFIDSILPFITRFAYIATSYVGVVLIVQLARAIRRTRRSMDISQDDTNKTGTAPDYSTANKSGAVPVF